MSKTYRIFISHAWDYIDYDKLVKVLDNRRYFNWLDYSVPEDDPLHSKSIKELYEGLKRHIRPTNCVLAIAAMNVPRRDFIQWEIEFAAAIDKPIIGVKPWGQIQVPTIVQDNAVKIVGWNTESIVSAIGKYSI